MAADPDVEAPSERLDDALRPVEVAVLRTPSAPREPADREARNELGRLIRLDQPRRHPLGVLHADVLGQAHESCVRVCDEQVAARLEAERHRRVQPLVRLGVERRRLARQPAGDRRSPLLANAAGLDTRGACADPAALEDCDSRTPSCQLPRDREPDDARSDHGDFEPRVSHIAQP